MIDKALKDEMKLLCPECGKRLRTMGTKLECTSCDKTMELQIPAPIVIEPNLVICRGTYYPYIDLVPMREKEAVYHNKEILHDLTLQCVHHKQSFEASLRDAGLMVDVMFSDFTTVDGLTSVPYTISIQSVEDIPAIEPFKELTLTFICTMKELGDIYIPEISRFVVLTDKRKNK